MIKLVFYYTPWMKHIIGIEPSMELLFSNYNMLLIITYFLSFHVIVYKRSSYWFQVILGLAARDPSPQTKTWSNPTPVKWRYVEISRCGIRHWRLRFKDPHTKQTLLCEHSCTNAENFVRNRFNFYIDCKFYLHTTYNRLL